MSSRRREGSATVSGPGIDKTYPGAGVATSAALTFALRSATPCTYYVRDSDGRGVSVVQRHDDNTVTVQRPAFVPGA